MSDIWQGPGWWLASDGKWYPADAQPPGVETPANEPSSTDAEMAAPSGTTTVATEDEGSADGEASGWQAIDPTDEAVASADAAAVAAEPPPAPIEPPAAPTADDVFADTADPAGWEPTETAELADGEPLVDAVPDPSESHAIDHSRTIPEPMARDEAWRKPSDEPLLTPPKAPSAGAPQVVDVAEQPEPIVQPVAPPPERSLGGILLIAALVISIVALAALIGWLFTRVSDGDTVTTPSSTTAAVVADDDESTQTTETPSDDTTDTADAGDTTDPVDPDDDDVSVFKLENGDCIKDEIGEGQVQTLVAVDCSEPHSFEVFRQATLTSDITEFDNDAITAEGERICAESFENIVPQGEERNLRFKWLQPTPDSWVLEEEPDRLITCLLFDEDGPLTGRVAQ